MHSFFDLNDMENYQGDLADIVRASKRGLAQPDAPVSSRDFQADTINISSSMEENRDSIFGDLFYNMRDPLLHELNIPGSSYFSTSVEETSAIHAHPHRHRVFEKEMNISPCNIFSRIQISPDNPTKFPVSPGDSSPPMMGDTPLPRAYKPSPMVSSDMINNNSPKGCLIDNIGQVQISSPQNPGIKRRKSQAKKVICIPAPAAASNRPSGEVVPSDLWAWRKYGQKPIKGSPYPRGYYRCSSSKGCSARKQVERSRTDPNMLVITYTSEHNHPWPTQKNALAGSTRSQPPKNNAGGSKSALNSQVQKTTTTSTSTKEEQKEGNNDTLSPTITAAASGSTAVKEELEDSEKQTEMDDNEYGEGLPQGLRAEMPDSSQSEDFFAHLEEIEADPLDLLFTQGYTPEEQKDDKALDPFSLFDWSGSGDNSPLFGGAKGGL